MRFRAVSALLLFTYAGLCSAQTTCFRSPAEAVSRTGLEASGGFRFEGTMRDPLNNGVWAEVGRCGHPGWPTLLVRVPENAVAKNALLAGRASSSGLKKEVAAVRLRTVPTDARADAPMVRAGEAVVVRQQTAIVQLEVEGVALSNAGAGEQVKVRIGTEQFVVGTVLGSGVVEIH